MSHSWGYEPENGPNHWHKSFAIASEGIRQSPIDIQTSTVKYDPELASLDFDYDPKSISSISNNGHTFTVHVKQSDLNDITGGPLKERYELAQFHCHWGSKDDVGSEHTVNGKHTASELHFVHWNTDKYKSVGDAIKSNEGIAVLGTFIKVGKEHPYWEMLLPYLEKVVHKDESANVTLEGDFQAAKLLPNNTADYYTYDGSLTTPPLYESVTWIVFKEPVEISNNQLKRFRALMRTKASESKQCCIVDNYRPVQELHGRVVRASFQA